MMKLRHMMTVAAAVSGMLFLASCSKDTVSGPGTQISTDAQAMQYIIQNTDTVAAFSASEDYSIDDEGMQNAEYELLSKYGVAPQIIRAVASDSSHPLRWGRHIFWDQIVRDYHVETFGDTLAMVNVTKTVPGEFWIGWGMHSGDTLVLDTLVKKPFSEIVKRNVIFKRVARHEDRLKNWVPIAITMVEGNSQGTKNFSIASLEVSETAHGYDTTLTDPLVTWFRLGLMHGCVPILPVHDSVTVRVTVTSADDSAEIVYLRHGIGWDGHERRRVALELVSTTGGPGDYTRVYARTFTTELHGAILAGRFNAMIDAFSRGSILDKAAPFANEFWGVPYIVARF